MKKLKWVLYPLFFVFVFFVSLYFIFPVDVLREYVIQKMEESLRGGRSGLGMGPKVHIKRLGLWRLTGVQMDEVKLSLDELNRLPFSNWEFESLKARVGLWGAIFGGPTYDFDTSLYGGQVNGSISLNKAKDFDGLSLTVKKLDLSKMSQVSVDGGLALAGVLDFYLDLHPGKDPKNKGTGTMTMSFKGLTIGPGQLALPGSGFATGLSVPKVVLGDLTGRMDIVKGEGSSEGLQLTGGDVKGSVDLAIELDQNLGRSQLTGSGWFKIEEQFLAKNPNVQALLDLTPDVKRASDPDGKIHFAIKGSLAHPRFTLQKEGPLGKRENLHVPSLKKRAELDKN